MFALNEEQRLIDDAIERALADHGPGDCWPVLAELGLLGIGIAEEHGGAGGGPVELMLLARRLGRHLQTSALPGTLAAGSYLLQQAVAGHGAQPATAVLAGVLTGEQRVSLAVFEQHARYSLESLETSATAGADRMVMLNGCKHYVHDAAAAGYLVVAAGSGASVALYLVDTSSAGVQVSPYESVDGTSLGTVRLDHVLVPADNCLFDRAAGRCALDQALAMAIFTVSAQTLGACEVALEKTIDYLKVREQFGQRLASFQALQHRAADLHTDIEMLRSLVLGSAQSLSHGINDASMADAQAALIMAIDTGDRVGREAIQMHGAVGMTQDLGVGRYLMQSNTMGRVFSDADHAREDFLRLALSV